MQRVQKRKIRSQQKKESSRQPWQVMLIGLGIAWGLTLIGIILMTAVFYAGWLSGSNMQYQMAAYAIMAVSVIAGTGYAFKKTTGIERLWSLGVIGGYFVIRFLLSAIFTFL